MERTNVSGSQWARNFISNSQARNYPTTHCYPYHSSHPKCHTPCHCHGPKNSNFPNYSNSSIRFNNFFPDLRKTDYMIDPEELIKWQHLLFCFSQVNQDFLGLNWTNSKTVALHFFLVFLEMELWIKTQHQFFLI